MRQRSENSCETIIIARRDDEGIGNVHRSSTINDDADSDKPELLACGFALALFHLGHISGFAFSGLFWYHHDLTWPDFVWIFNLLLVGKVNRGVTHAAPIDAARNLPERIAAPDNDRRVNLG